ncbi:cytochrome b [Sphingorhabdus contaminans]|uniref:Cytochrome b n=1 Tax=Sphingorhabdus contaminans TaxID=1343899 RepID=A0A553WKK6_9SPHN|nr:cytochrome b [Sphingorhabdus contaminans]TSB05247.1 cytochrome b [Sphingorhabdus contaminans]
MTKYSKTAIALHWIIAILIVANVALASMAEDLPRAARAAYMDPHKAIGISILALSVFRLFWRIGHKPPPLPEKLTGWQSTLGKAVHALFYFLIIAVPVTGWLMVSASPGAPPVDFFGLFTVDLPVSDSKALSGVGHEGHEILTKPLVILIFLHILAALKHQFIDRLPFLQRMFP